YICIYEYMYKCLYLEILLIHIISFIPFTMTLLPLGPFSTSKIFEASSPNIQFHSSSVSSPFTTNFVTYLYQNHQNTTVHKTLYPAHKNAITITRYPIINPSFPDYLPSHPATTVSCDGATLVPYCQVPPNSDPVDS
ncbi:hypothetical protein PanWU01x14_105940, partial [Parasponia andersonii]